jgi:hypothetical protein
MVFDRDAVHWHQGRRNMNLDRRKQIRRERQAYVERLLPVPGFRRHVPDPLDRPVDTVPHAVVHAGGDAERLNDLRGRVDPDQVVVGADQVAQAPDGMPFVASFCDIWLPREAAISERSIRLITGELQRRGVGTILIHAPSGSLLVAMRTRVHRRVCNDAGLTPDADPKPELLSAAVAAFGVWHMAASSAEITWSVSHGDATQPTGPPTSLRAHEMKGMGKKESVVEPAQDAADRLLDQRTRTI